jgi:Ran GTPase-activating protein (RanGAP) involved in mRNA processing and transport
MQTSNGPGPAAAAAHVTSESSGGSTSDGDGGISTAAAASHPESPIRDNTGMDLSATSSASPDLSTPNSPLHGASYMQSDVSDWSKKRRRPTGFFNNNSNDLSQQQQQQQSSSSLPSIDGENHALQNETSNTEVNSEHRTGPTEQDETKATGAAGDVYDTSRNDKEDQQEQPPASPQLAQHQQQVKDVTPLDITYRSTPASLRLKDSLVMRLAMAFPSGRIQVVSRRGASQTDRVSERRSSLMVFVGFFFFKRQIDLSRRGLTEETAELIGNTLRCNPTLAVLKLGYNDLGDKGTSVIASACSKDGRHHQNLTVLDLAFNEIGDEGCTALSLHMIAGNHTLRNLSLSGNNIRRKGATALAGAFMHGCALSRLRLSSNRIGREGTRLLAQAIAESENRVQQLMQRQGGIKIGYNIKPVTLEELFLDDTSMKAKGFATLSSMLITNYNLSTLSLTNNNVDDQDMALLSQALAQNKQLPLKSLILSFNNISCVGVECLMNAVWGSPTLREIKLDNNKIQDRGAQLCSVVLSSIRLAVLDISFNKITTVGIKALMKSLSENDSLQSLALCGIPMDQNASKAVSYALAYNQSLNRFNIDSCGVGYSGQRHIVAGIVSNRNVKLRALTGFPLARKSKILLWFCSTSAQATHGGRPCLFSCSHHHDAWSTAAA